MLFRSYLSSHQNNATSEFKKKLKNHEALEKDFKNNTGWFLFTFNV